MSWYLAIIKLMINGIQNIDIRKLIKDLEINGLDKRKFKKTINNLKSSNNVVNYYVNQNLIVNLF